MFNLFFKKSVFVMHGFPALKYYGFIKSFILNIAVHIGVKSATKTVSVSFWTKLINSTFFNLQSDSVIHNPVRYQFFSEKDIAKKQQIVLYVGRLDPSKRIIEIMNGFIRYKSQERVGNDYILKIIGEGNLKNKVLEYCNQYKFIDYLGHITNVNDLRDIYLMSEIFVSLSEVEPYGIVFAEAFISQCKIISPKHGGQVEFLFDDTETVFIDNVECIEEISNAIEKCVIFYSMPSRPPSRFDKFHPEYVADQYMRLFS